MVGEKGLEPLHIAALDPKSSASTNFATRPKWYLTEILLNNSRIKSSKIKKIYSKKVILC